MRLPSHLSELLVRFTPFGARAKRHSLDGESKTKLSLNLGESNSIKPLLLLRTPELAKLCGSSTAAPHMMAMTGHASAPGSQQQNLKPQLGGLLVRMRSCPPAERHPV